MKNNFLRKMMSVGRLTSRGKLMEATHAIQRALAAAQLPSTPVRAAATAGSRPAAAGYAKGAATRRDSAGDDVGTATDIDGIDGLGNSDRRDASRFAASSFTGADGTRVFKLFEPAGSGNRALPLIVMLHGCTQSPDDFAAGTRMNELAEASGFYVLYPEQAARSNANRCWNWFVPGDQRRGVGEPALLAGMTRHVIEAHGIDPDRVYVAGLSAGGAMAAILAREYPDVFAAAGVHSGLPAGAAYDVASAFGAMKSGAAAADGGAGAGPMAGWPLGASTSMWPGTVAAPATAAPTRASAPQIVFHGSADSTVAPANGDAVIAAALAERGEARPSETSGVAAAGRRWRRTVWRDGDRLVAEQWIVDGAPHAWSGGSRSGSFTDPDGPDASAEMLRFFLEHRQQRAT